jgi:hypothetical protein
VHDWTRVEAGIFHAFHTSWVGQIQDALNEGLLPPGYYALAEQHVGRPITDVRTLSHPAGGRPRSPCPPECAREAAQLLSPPHPINRTNGRTTA